MKIENLRTEKNTNRSRVTATVTWEDCDAQLTSFTLRPSRNSPRVCRVTRMPFWWATSCRPCTMGERRVAIDAEICSELQQGLITALSWLRHWYYPPAHEFLRIEAKTQSRPGTRASRRAGFFFSGGIDSFATLRQNRLTFPLEHPGSIKDGLLVYGLDLDDLQAFEYVKTSLRRNIQTPLLCSSQRSACTSSILRPPVRSIYDNRRSVSAQAQND